MCIKCGKPLQNKMFSLACVFGIAANSHCNNTLADRNSSGEIRWRLSQGEKKKTKSLGHV